MQLRMWMYDLAREQAPSLDHLFQMAMLTMDSGYNAMGLYLEHRFAYPSAPWAQGRGCVTPEMIRRLRNEFPSLQIVPFINLLGHFEGFLYTEYGKRYREELFTGLQACPAIPEFVDLCERLIDDTLNIFDSEIIHIGGDETAQLGMNDLSKARIAELLTQGGDENADGKALLYGSHFGPLAKKVKDAGRRPAVWGDMFLTHPTALEFMPKETLIFDWQYFDGVAKTASEFSQRGFEVVGCPTIQTYNSSWCHLLETEHNVRQVAADAQTMGLHGVCITTWECGLFGAYDTLFPMIRACGKMLNTPVEGNKPTVKDSLVMDAYRTESGRHGEWAELIGVELGKCGGTFAPGRIRSSLKVRLLLNANPFLAWMHHGEELSGDVGDAALDVCDRAMQAAPGEAEKGVTQFIRSSIEFVRIAEAARKLYAEGKAEAAISKLAVTRQLFEDLARVAKRTNERIGGSLADIERCRIAKDWVERVMARIRQYGDGSLGYLPAFEHLCHPKFVPHDQAAWWLINKWANQ